MYTQELKSILLLIIIATLKHCPDTVTKLLCIDKKVCFYTWLFVNPIKPCRTNTDLLGGINRVACGPKLFHLTSAHLMVCSGLLWPSVWPTVHTTCLAVSTGNINPPLIRVTCDIAGCVLNISKSSQSK